MTSEYLLSVLPALESALEPLSGSSGPLTSEGRGRLLLFAHLMAQFLLHGRATASTSPDIQLGEGTGATQIQGEEV